MTETSPMPPAGRRAAPPAGRGSGRESGRESGPVPGLVSGAGPARVPLPLTLLLILVILVPIEFGFYAGPLFFTWSKLYLIVVTFLILPRLGGLKLRLYDWMFIGHVLWSATAFALIYGGATALERSGTYVLEFLVVYLAVRIWITRLDQALALIGVLFVMVLVAALAALPEAVLRTQYIPDFATSITGTRYRRDDEVRMGIMRAASFFEHPILHGVFCSALLSLVWFTSSVPQRLVRVPVIGLGTFLSASSAPLLILILQFLLLGLERISRGLKRRATIFGGLGLGAVVFLETFSGRGAVGFLAALTLNPGTAYTRRNQWTFGIDDVLANPFFGIDPTTWTRPFWLAGSVDNYWLLMMMRSGIPSLLFLAAAVALIWLALARRDTANPQFAQLRTGWGLMMVALILGGATVAYFGKLQPLFAFYTGFGAALANCLLPQEGRRPEAAAAEMAAGPAADRRGPRYSRFPPRHRRGADRMG